MGKKILFGLIKFYKSARAQGIKPIIGSEILVIKDYDSIPGPLVLLVKNQIGYTNLTKLVSKAYVEGQKKGEPLVKIEWLDEQVDDVFRTFNFASRKIIL